jgi:hypothetical protein
MIQNVLPQGSHIQQGKKRVSYLQSTTRIMSRPLITEDYNSDRIRKETDKR